MRIMLMSVFCALLIASPLGATDKTDSHFGNLDTNRDNSLSKQEFLGGEVKFDKQKAVNLFPDMRAEEHKNDGALRESLFERMDTNDDGLLSTDEWHQVAPNILEIHF